MTRITRILQTTMKQKQRKEMKVQHGLAEASFLFYWLFRLSLLYSRNARDSWLLLTECSQPHPLEIVRQHLSPPRPVVIHVVTPQVESVRDAFAIENVME